MTDKNILPILEESPMEFTTKGMSWIAKNAVTLTFFK